MNNKMLLVIGELIGIIATVFIMVKVMILKPACFSLFDGYTSIVPLFITKIIELGSAFSRT